MDVFFASLLEVLRWQTFSLMLLGIAIGFAVGILPGLGGAVTLALMLPFTFGMDPVSTFAFLLGMHAVTATTGDITSVLFAIPGEAVSAATILDGYPMTRRGEAGRALGIVLFSSLLGAVLGAFALALSVPVVRPLVLRFGSPEFFMLTILGLSYVVALSGKSLLKGLLMGGLGFFLAMIGTDPQGGIPRYVLGQLYLWDGLDIVPVVVGLFAVPEILELMVTRSSIARAEAADLSQIMRGITRGALQGIADTFRHWWLVVRASLIGVFIGIIPGMGGGVAQWVAYAHAQQTSKHPEQFGKGSVEGLLAVGAVNNAKEGGSLIPTVAFGVPGSVSMAILLGGFLIAGLAPGPAMLGQHVDVTYSMVWVLVLSNILAVALSFLLLRQLAALTFIKGAYLVPPLLVLITLGAFTAHNTMADVVTMLIFGLVGWACVRWDWPRPPLLLALVLGQITERNLWLSYQLSGFAWLGRPLVLAILALTVLGVLAPSISYRRRMRRQQQAAAAGAAAQGV